MIAKKSYEKLEIDIDSFLRDIIHYFKNSTVNAAKFKEFQIALDITHQNILGFVKTRWLELFHSIKRINDKWDVLSHYMEGKSSFIQYLNITKFKILESRDESALAKRLSQEFNPFNRCLLSFLEIFLGDIIVTNKKFQEEKGNLTRIHVIMEDLLKRFSNILLLEDFKNLSISERLKIIIFKNKEKKPTFSNQFKKNDNQILKYFLERYSEDTKINN